MASALIKNLSEYEKTLIERLNLVQSKANTIHIRKCTLSALNKYMQHHGYEVYTPEIGAQFITEDSLPMNAENKSWLVKRLNHICLESQKFWVDDFSISKNYRIQNSSLKNLYDLLVKDIQILGLKNYLVTLNRCVFRLDIYMQIKHYDEYTPEIGMEFLNIMKPLCARTFLYRTIYEIAIERLNSKLAGRFVLWRIRATYEVRHEDIRNAMTTVAEQLRNNHFSEDRIDHFETIIRNLDFYMTQEGLETYNFEIGQKFLSKVLQSHDADNDQYFSSLHPCIAQLNEAFEGHTVSFYHVRNPRMCPSQFQDVMDAFLTYYQETNRPSTIQEKQLSCNLFFEYLTDHNCYSVDQVTRQLVADACKNISSHYWGVIREFLQYCLDTDRISDNLAYFVPAKRTKLPIPTYYTKEERIKVLNAPDRSLPMGKRDYAIILIIIKLGLRSSDITHLKMSNLDRIKKRININQYKTDNYQSLPLYSDVEEAIDDYILNGRPDTKSEYIFIGNRPP